MFFGSEDLFGSQEDGFHKRLQKDKIARGRAAASVYRSGPDKRHHIRYDSCSGNEEVDLDLVFHFRWFGIKDTAAVRMDGIGAVNNPHTVAALFRHLGIAVGKDDLVFGIAREGIDCRCKVGAAGAPKIKRVERSGAAIYDCGYPDPLAGDRIPYWYAFWQTPHPSGYGPDDFCRVNAALFPGGPATLEVYEWTTDWSNYFDDGREWWGTACWSVYDKHLDRFAVLFASTTD